MKTVTTEQWWDRVTSIVTYRACLTDYVIVNYKHNGRKVYRDKTPKTVEKAIKMAEEQGEVITEIGITTYKMRRS